MTIMTELERVRSFVESLNLYYNHILAEVDPSLSIDDMVLHKASEGIKVTNTILEYIDYMEEEQ